MQRLLRHLPSQGQEADKCALHWDHQPSSSGTALSPTASLCLRHWASGPLGSVGPDTESQNWDRFIQGKEDRAEHEQQDRLYPARGKGTGRRVGASGLKAWHCPSVAPGVFRPAGPGEQGKAGNLVGQGSRASSRLLCAPTPCCFCFLMRPEQSTLAWSLYENVKLSTKCALWGRQPGLLYGGQRPK